MPQLILMRHAKAVDRMEAEDDFERGLTQRGRDDARRAAEAMASAGLKADQALVSPARRTRETWAIVADTLGAPPVSDPLALYHASASMLARAVMEALDAGAQSIVVVGHNPGLGGLAHDLAGTGERARAMPAGWPTSAAAAFDIAPGVKSLNALALTFAFDPKAAR
ncbi:histidine phosphatase family protein [Alkalicaulis satelles]|uniref:Histidine phosphatase family protein n=1 Tax=Alkalicaulis satelles TaxID=2609175 RepID=A0A5M6Z8L0_9PROT|nr:histidine phosphatase family protein [Alkalicaulis satelles]KAA5800979.1 histidine phosphatase family protein [Alkalicaulis satelles]